MNKEYAEALASDIKKFYEENAFLFMLVCATSGEETFRKIIEEGSNQWFNETADKIESFKATLEVQNE